MMTNKAKPDLSLERLGDVLDACGPSPATWPEDERAGLIALSRSNGEAGRLVHEAQMLSRLLDEARGPAVSDALKSRIIEAARRSGNESDPGERDVVVAFPSAATARRILSPHLPQAALLAASLLIGAWAGVSGTMDGLIEAPLEMAGFISPDNGSAETLLFGGGLDTTEDLL